MEYEAKQLLTVIDKDAAANSKLGSSSRFGSASSKRSASVDERVFKYFPEYAEIRTPEKDAITLRHLLTMSPGLRANESVDWNSPFNTEREMYQSVDPYRAVLNQEFWKKAG